MNIVNEKKENKERLSRVLYGSVFLYKDEFYIKTSDYGGAVRLSDGNSITIDSSTNIVPVNAELHIKD